MPNAPAPRILLVDDEPAVRTLITRLLRSQGYEVVAVTDGMAGLDAAKPATARYDLVITNSCMPHLTGEQLIAHLRALAADRAEQWPTVPILLVSGQGGPPASYHGPFLPKPYMPAALIEAIARLLPPTASSCELSRA